MSEVREDAVEKAKRLGLRLVEPNPDELLIDIDSFEQRADFDKRFRQFLKLWPDAEFVVVPSVSGKVDHCHIYVNSPALEPLDPLERVALQAALGSDPFREMLAVIHKRAGYKYTSVFFEKP